MKARGSPRRWAGLGLGWTARARKSRPNRGACLPLLRTHTLLERRTHSGGISAPPRRALRGPWARTGSRRGGKPSARNAQAAKPEAPLMHAPLAAHMQHPQTAREARLKGLTPRKPQEKPERSLTALPV